MRRAAVGVGRFGVLLLILLQLEKAHAAPPSTPRRVVAEARIPAVTGLLELRSVAALSRSIAAWEAERNRLESEEEREERERKEHKAGEPEAEEGIELLKAALAYLAPRAFPADEVAWPRIVAAARDRAHLAPARWTVEKTTARWEFIGPENIPVPYRIYFGQGPLAGRVNAVAFHPRERNIYYLGAAGGGIWKTTDGGGNWAPLTDGWPLLSVSALVCLAGEKENVTLLAGTGDFPYPAIAPALGLMRSDDSGVTWRSWGPDALRDFAVSRILVDPEDPRVITVSCGRGVRQWGSIWRTSDGGVSWSQVVEDPACWCDLSCGALGPQGRRWYWTVGYEASGHRRVLRSADRGATWREVYRTSTHDFLSLAKVQASPVDSEVAYVLLGGLQKILVTRNGGDSFTDVTRNFPGGYNWTQDWYDLWMGVSSVRTGNRTNDSIYIGLIDLVHSLDAQSWRSIGRTYTPSALAHNDQQAGAIDPFDPTHLLTASDGGLYDLRHTVPTGAHAFKSLNARLGITQIYRAAVAANDASVLLGGTQDNATPARQGANAPWINVGGGDGAYCAIHPARPEIQFAASQFQAIYRTQNRWKSHETITPNFGVERRAFIAPFVLDPSDGNQLYAGTNYLWRWNDAQRRWTPRLGNHQHSASGYIQAIAVAPSDGKVLYTGSNQGELWLSRDAGAHWTRLDATPFPRRTITQISVHPTRPLDVLVSVSGTGASHLWHCADAAAPRWTDASATVPDAPANTILRDPLAPETHWFLGTDVGVFATTTAGATWTDASASLGLPGVQVTDLLYTTPRHLTAATFGRGFWRIPLPR